MELLSDNPDKYDIFNKITKKVADRILQTLGLEPNNPSEKMNWETFLNFKRILITFDAPKN